MHVPVISCVCVQAQLKRTEIDVQQMIQERVSKVEEIQHSVQLNKVSPSEMKYSLKILMPSSKHLHTLFNFICIA